MSDPFICPECGDPLSNENVPLEPGGICHPCAHAIAESTISKQVSARDLMIRDLRADLADERIRTNALLDALPKCDNCSAPATKARQRGAGRWCDVHGQGAYGVAPPVPDYPRADAIRAIQTARANNKKEG